MKHFFIFLSLFLIVPAVMSAQDVPNDSIVYDHSVELNDSVMSQHLDEVVVEGRTQRVVKFGVEYTPDKKTKKVALDATNLLAKMMIPKLTVAPGSSSVTTNTGKEVSMFIDYVPATSQDLEGLRPEDVLRVEVLDYPDDPRFESAAHVVNFIMQKYEWGGYTKATLNGSAAWGSEDLPGWAYSKFVYRKWTLDANAYGSGSRRDKTDTRRDEIYRDVDFDGRHYDMIRRSSVTGDDYLVKNNNLWTSLRLSYRTENVYLQHRLSFSRQGMPTSRSTSGIVFDPAIVQNPSATSVNSSQSLSPWISGYYQFTLPRGHSIMASWSFSYGSTKSSSFYQLEDTDPILNDNREKVYSPDVTLQYSKKLDHGITLRTSLISSNSVYRTRYAGSFDGLQKLLSSENMLFLEYMQNWKFGLSLYSRVGASYVVGRVNGVTTLRQWNPRLGLQLEYQVSDCHSVSLEGWWGNSHPSGSTSNTALVQSNELLWLQGNPDIKNTIFNEVQASYTFVPDNRFSLSVSVDYERNGDKQAYEYFTLPGHDGLVRRTVNSGSSHRYQAWVNGTYKIIPNLLSVNLYGSAERAVLTGMDARSKNMLYGGGTLNYMPGNWSVMVFYSSPMRSFGGWSNGTYSKYDQSYGLSASYAVGDLRVGLNFRNWFTKKGYSETIYTSPRYDDISRSLASWNSRYVGLTLSYTISYGKKIMHGDEMQGGGGNGVDSAILR